MQTMNVSESQANSIEAARDTAVRSAREQLQDPVVLSWRDDRRELIAPEIPGAATATRWEEYGEANGGRLRVDVGEDYHFILGEAADFLEPHSLFTNVEDDQGNVYMCVTGACTDEDRRRITEGFGSHGGKGG
jgi:hypothetical protein